MARVLALDVGDVRIGVALSDASGILASPVTIIDGTNQEAAIQAIKKIVKEKEVARIIAGIPYSLNGSIGPQAEKVQAFITALQQQTDIIIELRDERYTTLTAVEYKKANSKKKLDRKTRYDAMAAAIILQEYLDEKR